MPRYTYKCKKCNELFDFFHSMNENMEECVVCGESLERMYSVNTFNKFYYEKSLSGEYVKKFIEEAKEEIKIYKQELKREEIK